MQRMNQWSSEVWLRAVVLAVIWSTSLAAGAATRSWTDSNGFWSVAGNTGDTVNIIGASIFNFTVTYDYTGSAVTLNSLTVDQAGSSFVSHGATLSMAANNLTANSETIGDSSNGGSNGRGTFSQSGGNNNVSGTLLLGNKAGDLGTYNLSNAGGSVPLQASSEVVGESGSGSFNETGGSNTSGTITLGDQSGSSGSYSLSAGGLSATQILLGKSGTGTFDHSGGSSTLTTQLGQKALVIGANSTSNNTYTLSGTGILTVTGDESIGDGGTGTFNQTGGTHNLGINCNLYVGNSGGSVGAYSLSGTASLNCFGAEFIGSNGTGMFTQSGGTNTDDQVLSLGGTVNSSGTYNLSGGTLSCDGEFLGEAGAASFNQSGGSNTSSGPIRLAENFSASPTTYTITGGALDVEGDLSIGEMGPATFTQSAGTNTITAGHNLYLGNKAGSQGIYNLSDTGVLMFSNPSGGNEYIGYDGTGKFQQTDAANSGGELYIGYNSGALGSYTLNGTGSLTFNQEQIGVSGFGTFTQSGGTNTTNAFVIGQNGTSNSSFNQSGGSLSVTNVEEVGFSGTGQFLHSGGTNTVTEALELGVTLGSGGFYTLSGSGFLISNAEYVGFDGFGQFVQSGGSNSVAAQTGATQMPALYLGFNSDATGSYTISGGSATINGSVYVGGSSTGPGGSGALGVSGTGSFSVSGSLVIYHTPSSGVSMNGGSLIAGSLTNSGALTVMKGLVNVGATTFNSTSILGIGLGGTTRGSNYGAVITNGSVSLAGALQVSLTGGFTPTVGETFDILDWGSLSGTFSSVDLPTSGGRFVWDTSQLYTTGTISVVATYLAGDINRDGQVTVADIAALMTAMADLIAYQAAHPDVSDPQHLLQVADVNGDGNIDNADLQALITLIANHAAGGGELTAVREPATITLGVIGLGILAMCRLRSPAAR
jgi:Dockerin type I domain